MDNLGTNAIKLPKMNNNKVNKSIWEIYRWHMTMSRLLIQYLNMQSLSYEMYLFTVRKSNQISSCLSWALKLITWPLDYEIEVKDISHLPDRHVHLARNIYTQYHCPTMYRDWETELNLKT